MSEAITFGDIEAALLAHLPTVCGVPCMSEIPDKRPASFVTIKRGGGSRRSLTMDAPNIEFECWAGSREAAHTLAQTVRAQVHALQGVTISGLTIYKVAEFAGPVYLRHPISAQDRYTFSVALFVRYPG